MSEYTHKMVDGVLVPLTPQEVAEAEASAAQSERKQIVGETTLDMGRTMFEILTT